MEPSAPAPHVPHAPHVRPEGRLARCAAGQLGLVTRSQALASGCSDKVLARLCRSGQVVRARRGVYRFCSTAPSYEQSVLAACLATSGAVASSVTAVRLYGFRARSVRRAGRTIHIVAPFGREQPVAGGVLVHRTRSLGPRERRVVAGAVPVTSPLRTLEDVAGLLDNRELEDFVGHLLATRLVTSAELSLLGTTLAQRPSGRKGSRRLRQCLERAGLCLRTESVLERRALVLLDRAGLPAPTTQLPVFDGEHRFVGRADIAWAAERVILEVDGYRWHAAPRAFRLDRRKSNRLQSLGWTVLRVSAEDVADGMVEVIGQLRVLLGKPGAGSAHRLEGDPVRIA